jgi:hypothetical protein
MPNGSSGQGPLCQGSLQSEQKSVEQFGQCTGPGEFPLDPLSFNEQMVSQPARGHHALSLSIDTSVKGNSTQSKSIIRHLKKL